MPRILFVIGILLSAWMTPGPAWSSVTYEFCVDRVSSTNNEKFGVRYSFGDIDPGKEIARVLVSQKYKQATTQSVSVTDYSDTSCGPIREEANVTLTGEQIQQLGDAISRGDLAATAIIAGEVVVGVTVSTVQSVGNVISDVVHKVGCWLGIGC